MPSHLMASFCSLSVCVFALCVLWLLLSWCPLWPQGHWFSLSELLFRDLLQDSGLWQRTLIHSMLLISEFFLSIAERPLEFHICSSSAPFVTWNLGCPSKCLTSHLLSCQCCHFCFKYPSSFSFSFNPEPRKFLISHLLPMIVDLQSINHSVLTTSS